MFATDEYLLLTVSRTERAGTIGDRFEQSTVFSFNIKTRAFTQLLANAARVLRNQSGFGGVVGVDPDGQHVYMPAYTGATFNRASGEPTYDLLKINLATGGEVKGGSATGKSGTTDWLVDANGRVIVREDFFEKSGAYEITAFDTGRSRSLYADKPGFYIRNVLGVSPDGTTLFISDPNSAGLSVLQEMSLSDGELRSSPLRRNDADIDALMTDRNRVVSGVLYSGPFPSYEMFDPQLDRDVQAFQDKLSGMSVYLDSLSDDRSKLLFLVTGGYMSDRMVLLDRATGETQVILQTRPQISPEQVGEIITMQYPARDGLNIPGLITGPTGVAEADRKNLPMIVLRHGGPQSYDSVRFDWLAQFLANEGFVVLQPNFRGSSGFGLEFAEAGYGEWGGKMQDDVTDGVKAMTGMGWADPERVCIVGWSYGGYSALRAQPPRRTSIPASYRSPAQAI